MQMTNNLSTFSDYVLENLRLKQELDSLRYHIHCSVEAYERLGEVTNFEDQPLIYAQVLLDLWEKAK